MLAASFSMLKLVNLCVIYSDFWLGIAIMNYSHDLIPHD
jgi:hypothetical protein